MPAGRPNGSGYKSQAIVLSSLRDGQLCFEEIVDETGLHRNTVASNLKVLVDLNLVVKERVGQKVIYDLQDEGADAYADLILDPQWKKKFKRARRIFWRDAKDEAATTLLWIKYAEKYKKESEEFQAIDPNFKSYNLSRIFHAAKEWRNIKEEKLGIIYGRFPRKRMGYAKLPNRQIGLSVPKRRVKDIHLPSDEAQRVSVKKSVIKDLLDFKKENPQLIEEYKKIVKTKLKQH